MIICSYSNIDIIQGVIGYGDAEGITDWRISNTSNGILNILNSSSENTRISINTNGNVGIGSKDPSTITDLLDVSGNINISGIYEINNRDVISDTSNYVLATSNILVNRINTISIGGGGSSQWTTGVGNVIYYNTSNVGIGATNPSANLHIYNDAIYSTRLLVQNNSTPILTAPNNITSSPSVSSTLVTGNANEKYMLFTYDSGRQTSGQTPYTLTFAEAYNCDILIIGGGGAGGTVIAGGGGAGSIIYASGFNVGVGTYTFNVGRGGIGVTATTGGGSIVGGSGVSSTAFGATAIGGGGGGQYNGNGGIVGGSGGGCGGGASQAAGGAGGSGGLAGSSIIGGLILQSATFKEYLCNNGGFPFYYQNAGNSYSTIAGGGGGANALGGGTPNNTTKTSANGNGGDGKSYNITGTSTTYGGGGGGGSHRGALASIPAPSSGTGGSGGGGDGANDTSVSKSGTKGVDGTGGGGGGSSYNSSPTGIKGGDGGHGIIILRYRTIPSTSSSIELIRGNISDSNIDYKVGNYGGEFKIISSINNVDTDYVKITSTGAIYNPTGTSSWTTTSDRRIKENIEEASYNKCYDNINTLGLYRFNYVEGFNNVNKDIKQLGFIAQEVNKIFPKSVILNNNYNIPDLLTIDITQINYTLYGAVKKLIKQNEDKDRRIKRLETLLNIEDTPIDTSNIVLDTSNISIDTSNIIIDNTEYYMNRYWQYLNGYTSNIAIDTSNITIHTSNIAIDTSNIAIDTSNIAIDTSNISLDTSNIAIDTSNIDQTTSNLNSNTSNIPTE